MPKYIGNSLHIRADSARMDRSKAVQATSVQVPKNWGLVRTRSKNFSDWIGLDLDGPGPEWSIAGLVESLHASELMDGGRDKAWAEIDRNYYGITQKQVAFLLDHCTTCAKTRSVKTSATVEVIVALVHSRSQSKITNTLLCTHVCACTGMYIHSAGSM